jgi:hypothetical protein
MITSASFNETLGARRVRSDAQLMAADQVWLYETLSASPAPAKKLKTLAADISLLVAGWALLIGIVVYPQAQLVGITACAIALFVARKK